MTDLLIDTAQLVETMRLLDEAYDHYFRYGDGHCKSSEGAISVHFGNYFDRRHDGHPPLKIKSVDVYSYVFGPHRSHYFPSTNMALLAARKWHEDEMNHDYDADNAAYEAWLDGES